MRPVSRILLGAFLLTFHAPPAAAFRPARETVDRTRTQTPNAQQRQEIQAQEREKAQKPAYRELSEAELAGLYAAGPYRNRYFNGVSPWQRSFRDVNLCNGNLFKSFTDIQVTAARGAGLGLQRNYNSNDDRIGPFGVGWSHAYDMRIEEAGSNNVPRTDLFGKKHTYRRDADGLYSPPAYLYDELYSDYVGLLDNGPQTPVSDDQIGMDGSVKHFVQNGNERVISWMEDRHGNRTNFTYGLTVTIGGVQKNLLTRVTDAVGRYLDFTWTNLGTTPAPAWRITQAQGPYTSGGAPVFVVAYEYNAEFNLWKVRHDPAGLNRTVTFGYTTYVGGNGTETGLLASVTDPLGVID
ncbi:MAG: hypothetical protein FJ315_07440 [SAR202 cluster bacterium]|nr:hypothetical protein [SAR202 cluster bacterium]